MQSNQFQQLSVTKNITNFHDSNLNNTQNQLKDQQKSITSIKNTIPQKPPQKNPKKPRILCTKRSEKICRSHKINQNKQKKVKVLTNFITLGKTFFIKSPSSLSPKIPSLMVAFKHKQLIWAIKPCSINHIRNHNLSITRSISNNILLIASIFLNKRILHFNDQSFN